jgi:hypothetical protein
MKLSPSFQSRSIRLWLLVVLSAALLCGQASTGRVEGIVMDSSGALMPNAKVTVRDMKRDIPVTSTTGADGHFIFPSLQPSTYQLVVEAAGFNKAVVENIEVNVSVTVSQQIKLEVGAVTEQVVVSAEAVRVNVSDAQLGRTITMKDIDSLPQLGRNPMALAVFQPGVAITNPGDTTFARINGGRQGSNNAKLDGIDVNDAVVPRLGLSLTAVNLDSVGEFRIITNGGKAEYGRNAGGQMEMITRSGTNSFHGNGYEYLRNTELNANTFFSNRSGLPRPKFIQNTFGGAFGGRLIKDKTFFFGNYQGQRTAQEVVRNRTVLTPEAKAGNFRYVVGGVTQSVNIPSLDPLGRGIDPFVKTNALDLLPNPNNVELGDGLNTAGFRFNNPNSSYSDQFTIKADHQLTSTHRIFYRHSWFRTYSIDALNNADATFPGQPQGNQGGTRWGYGVGSDWAITPTLINEFRFGHQTASTAFNRPGRPQGPAFISNLFTDPINSVFAQGRNSPVYDFSNNMTKIAGKHTFKGGYTFRRVLQYGYNDAGAYPNITTGLANGNAPTVPNPPGASSADAQRFQLLYNDLLGRVSQVTTTFYSDLTKFQPAGSARIRDFLLWDHSFFFQDDWKVNRKLTLNVGVRYELFGPPTELSGYQGTLDQIANIGPTANIDGMSVVKRPKFYNRDKNDFAPRIGFAWDPTGSGKTAIRGSYGLYYDRIIGATTSSVDGATPGFAQAVNVLPNQNAGSDVRISTPTPYPQLPPAPVLTQPSNRNITVTVFGEGLKTGYVHQANFTIQRELLRNTVLDLGWVRTRGSGLFVWADYNQPRAYGDFLTAFQELQRFSTNGAAPSANNTLVRIFGTPAAAVTGVGGATVLSQGLLYTGANNVDRTNFSRYAAAGLNQFYLRNYPQFNQLFVGVNEGKSWYDSFQMSLRRTAGALTFQANYTWSKNLDNISVEGNGTAGSNVIDNYNFNNFKGRSDADIPHSFNGSFIYELPIGTGKFIGGGMPRWASKIVGGWAVGSLVLWQSGATYTIGSQRLTSSANLATWANYSGDRNFGKVERRGNGVFWFDPSLVSQFSFPNAGEFGTSGRNSFRGPRYFGTDLSLVKRFGMPWGEQHRVTFRAEMYNAFNNANFANPSVNITNTATFGQISAITGNQRLMQMALRYDF